MADDLLGQLGRLDPATLQRLVSEAQERDASRAARQRRPESIDRLKSLAHELQQHEDFQVGQLVEWKPGLKNRTMPPYDAPAIVLEVVNPPVLDDTKSAGSSYFRELLTLKLGFIDDDDELGCFHYDGRRFRSYVV